jgi:hypothetical protein
MASVVVALIIAILYGAVQIAQSAFRDSTALTSTGAPEGGVTDLVLSLTPTWTYVWVMSNWFHGITKIHWADVTVETLFAAVAIAEILYSWRITLRLSRQENERRRTET